MSRDILHPTSQGSLRNYQFLTWRNTNALRPQFMWLPHVTTNCGKPTGNSRTVKMPFRYNSRDQTCIVGGGGDPHMREATKGSHGAIGFKKSMRRRNTNAGITPIRVITITSHGWHPRPTPTPEMGGGGWTLSRWLGAGRLWGGSGHPCQPWSHNLWETYQQSQDSENAIDSKAWTGQSGKSVELNGFLWSNQCKWTDF